MRNSIVKSKVIFCFLTLLNILQKNKPGKIIVVYDDDEKLAPTVATSLLQKDVENVIMLSGGKSTYSIISVLH